MAAEAAVGLVTRAAATVTRVTPAPPALLAVWVVVAVAVAEDDDAPVERAEGGGEAAKLPRRAIGTTWCCSMSADGLRARPPTPCQVGLAVGNNRSTNGRRDRGGLGVRAIPPTRRARASPPPKRASASPAG